MYKTIKQTEISGKKSYILIRPDGTKTSALTENETFAILSNTKIVQDLSKLIEKISLIDANSVMFGSEVIELFSGAEQTYAELADISNNMEIQDDCPTYPTI